MSERAPEGRFVCAGCLIEFKDSRRRECCLNCDSSGTSLPQDEIDEAQSVCPRRIKYLAAQQKNAA